MLEAFKLVEAGAGGGKQHNCAIFPFAECISCGVLGGGFQRFCANHFYLAFECFGEHIFCIAD